MKNEQLVGTVAAAYLKEKLSQQDDEGTARFLVDCLTADQTASVAKAIIADNELSNLVEIKFPIHFVGNHGLSEVHLTDERTTWFRNADCAKPALLVANTGDDEEQSLKEIEPIGRPQLYERIDLWVGVASKGLPLADAHKTWWEKALAGLLEARNYTLERFGEYILKTGAAIENGHPILAALGVALPALQIPKDSAYFGGLAERYAGHKSRWKNLYSTAIKKRACYLLKLTPAQTPLTEEVLRKSFEKVRDFIPDDIHPYVEVFIKAPGGWNEHAIALSDIEWEIVKPVFDGLKRENFNLGKETKRLFDEIGADERLTKDELDYLDLLEKRKTTESNEEDEEFYQNHRLELDEAVGLKTKWDRFIYGTPVESDDFIVGIALCLEALFDRNLWHRRQKLTIRCDRKTKKNFKGLNNEAGRFFCCRYRGLPSIWKEKIKWDVGHLFDFDDLDREWRVANQSYVNRSVAKSALKLKFFLELEVETSQGEIETSSKQLIWVFNPNAVTSELPDDWSRLCEHPFVGCLSNREPVSGKGRFQSIDLENAKTLMPTFGRNRGSFVGAYKKENDISVQWRANLKKALNRSLITELTAKKLERLFESFEENYSLSIKEFAKTGVASNVILKQAEDYAILLHTICEKAKGDSNRALLLRPLLRLGTVEIEGGKTSSIVAPWNPLRLRAMAVKSRRISNLLSVLLGSGEVSFGDPRLFFKELRDELAHPYYPEVILGWDGNHAKILSLSDHYLDYSLHESPVISRNVSDDTNENPTESANLILDMVKRFLSLYPHEKSNLSLVLYDSDSARLPQAIVGKINDLHEDESAMRCEIILRHRDGNKLRNLYTEIVGASDGDPDSFIASEVNRDFMARLRIGIMANQAPAPDPRDGPPADIVFLEDVIARHASIEWYPEDAKPVETDGFIPTRWSRRRPSPTDDMKAIVYLCCPVQDEIGWSYITAITTFIKGDWDETVEKRLLPARQLDFGNNETAAIFKETHNLGSWVVNYDELLDKRQLLNQNVRIIRYKQFATQGRNLLVSSTAPLGLLRSMILRRTKDLNLELSDQDYSQLADKFIDDAMDISGDIVLRAAKRGRHASELMGVVLSRFLIRKELGPGGYHGWYFLDDYAEWLGQREQHIADILALSPEKTADGKMRLSVIVSEAKYIDHASLSTKRKESQKQLRDTMRRIDDALFGDPARLDRGLWLSRFSDLVLNGIQFPAGSDIDLSAWRRAIREGQCEIFPRGYSHVFVSGPTDCPNCSDCSQIADLDDSFQEVFSRQELRRLVLKYFTDEDPLEIRRDSAGENIWRERNYRGLSEKNIYSQKEKENASAQRQTKTNGSESGEPKSRKHFFSEDVRKGTEQTEPEETGKTGLVSSIWPYSGVGKLIGAYNKSVADSEKDENWLEDTVKRCKGALQQFQLRSKLLEKALTPNAALLKFQGSSNLTVEQVLKRRSELLTTHRLNIISVRPEPGVVSISVARPERRVLHLLDVWKNWAPDCTSGNHEILIGLKEDDSSLLVFSPKNNAPHTLIAGSTGSGKSVLMQNIILAISCTNTPEQAHIVIIDPKLGVDYFAFENLPHMHGDIIDDQQNAISVLSDLVSEMDRRYSLLRKNKVSNIYELNAKEDATEHPPFLWIIHDEFAEWMMTKEYSAEVSDVVARLGVKARAAGIFLVFAAQRPDVHVMPMQLRANLGNRLILRVDSEGTSEIALGEKGAERLLGKGHLIAKIEGNDGLIAAQVPFIGSDEIEKIVSELNT